ncbi:hypothetical protein ACWIEX_05990 [Bosea sp. NPDC055353]
MGENAVAAVGASVNPHDLTGRKFGPLEVLERAPTSGKNVMWRCRCDCGAIYEKRHAHVVNIVREVCNCLPPKPAAASAPASARSFRWYRDGEAWIAQGERYYARCWFSHRAAMARTTFGNPQSHVEIVCPFRDASDAAMEKASQRARALMGGCILTLGLLR